MLFDSHFERELERYVVDVVNRVGEEVDSVS